MTDDTKICEVCGNQVTDRIAHVQYEVNGLSCESCLKSVRDHPQLQSLFDEIENALKPTNAAIWADSDFSDRLTFALQQITRGHIDGGTEGFHHELRKYAAYHADVELTDN